MSIAEKSITFKPLKKGKTLLLFDIDGTLAPFIKKMEDDMKNEIIKIKKTIEFSYC
jgi:trehalose-6-phosphatase